MSLIVFRYTRELCVASNKSRNLRVLVRCANQSRWPRGDKEHPSPQDKVRWVGPWLLAHWKSRCRGSLSCLIRPRVLIISQLRPLKSDLTRTSQTSSYLTSLKAKRLQNLLLYRQDSSLPKLNQRQLWWWRTLHNMAAFLWVTNHCIRKPPTRTVRWSKTKGPNLKHQTSQW